MSEEDAAEKVGLSKKEIMEMMKERTQLIVKRNLSNLAYLLDMSFTGEEDVEKILTKVFIHNKVVLLQKQLFSRKTVK